jgi:hypothetical protein
MHNECAGVCAPSAPPSVDDAVQTTTLADELSNRPTGPTLATLSPYVVWCWRATHQKVVRASVVRRAGHRRGVVATLIVQITHHLLLPANPRLSCIPRLSFRRAPCPPRATGRRPCTAAERSQSATRKPPHCDASQKTRLGSLSRESDAQAGSSREACCIISKYVPKLL